MSLAGNLRTMSLPDILQWIDQGRKTGTLYLDHGSIQKRIAFREGTIFSSWSNDPRESLGQFLVRYRRVSEEQLFRALLEQEKAGRLIGSILIGEGVLSEQELQEDLRTKAEETVYDVFLWLEGRFEFKEGELPEKVTVHVRMPIQGVILEGIRRVDEWQRIRKLFPSTRTTFKLVANPHLVSDELERKALGLVASGKTLAEIGLEMHQTDFEAAFLLYDLCARDLVRVDRVEPEAEDPVARIRELLEAAESLSRERRYDEAMKAYEEVLALDRLNQNAKKGLIALVEARGRERAIRAVPLAKVPVLKKDLIALTKENFDPLEGFVISRVNGQWDVRSILKLCPMPEDDALLIFSRLVERGVIDLKDPA